MKSSLTTSRQTTTSTKFAFRGKRDLGAADHCLRRGSFFDKLSFARPWVRSSCSTARHGDRMELKARQSPWCCLAAFALLVVAAARPVSADDLLFIPTADAPSSILQVAAAVSSSSSPLADAKRTASGPDSQPDAVNRTAAEFVAPQALAAADPPAISPSVELPPGHGPATRWSALRSRQGRTRRWRAPADRP